MNKKEKYNVAVIGVGAVGVELLKILNQRSFPVDKLRVFARSKRDISVDGKTYHVEAIEKSDFSGIDIALFAGTEGAKGASVTYADKFIEQGAVVIDNGADFRLKADVPLIVPEANNGKVKEHKGLIANPNCTTIQAVVALAGIQKKKGLEKMLLVSFQAVSGAGKSAAQTLWDETKEIITDNKDNDFPEQKSLKKDFSVFGSQIAFNTIPQIGRFRDDGYTSEEQKVIDETRKIYGDEDIKISATCVRVPVFTSHSQAIYFKTKNDAGLDEIIEILANSEGIRLFKGSFYPLPLDAEGTDMVYIGRVRSDPNEENSFWVWVVADNLRKGAALNAIQIAEELIRS